MFGNNSHPETQRIGFLLLPDFSMMAFTSSVEPLRAANRMSHSECYHWSILTADGAPVAASNGVIVTPDSAFSVVRNIDVLFVCAGLNAHNYTGPEISGKLREFSRAGIPLGSVCTGSIALAEAGLLNGYRCTIHWENIEGFVEAYPQLDVTATLFEIDRDRYTCSGGTAALDMMIHAIAMDHGDAVSISVAEQMLQSSVRQPHDHQRMSIRYRTGISNPKLLAAIGYMEAYIETPIPLRELAASVSISLRQLERLFRSFLDTTPAKYYLELRLQRAQLLLTQTSMSVLQVAVATGFSSGAHFTQSYRTYFGHPPSAERSPPEQNRMAVPAVP